jgi:hypothetical protein
MPDAATMALVASAIGPMVQLRHACVRARGVLPLPVFIGDAALASPWLSASMEKHHYFQELYDITSHIRCADDSDMLPAAQVEIASTSRGVGDAQRVELVRAFCRGAGLEVPAALSDSSVLLRTPLIRSGADRGFSFCVCAASGHDAAVCLCPCKPCGKAACVLCPHGGGECNYSVCICPCPKCKGKAASESSIRAAVARVAASAAAAAADAAGAGAGAGAGAASGSGSELRADERAPAAPRGGAAPAAPRGRAAPAAPRPAKKPRDPCSICGVTSLRNWGVCCSKVCYAKLPPSKQLICRVAGCDNFAPSGSAYGRDCATHANAIAKQNQKREAKKKK